MAVKTLSIGEYSYGTSLMGFITTTRSDLERVFGSPTIDDGNDTGDKVTTEWYLLSDDGTRATIYDWKRYEQGAPEMNERYEWHIGGDSAEAVTIVSEALGLSGRVF